MMTSVAVARKGGPLIRISLPWAVECVSSFERVKTMSEGLSPLDAFLIVSSAKTSLDELIHNSVYALHLKVSIQQAAKFKAVIDSAFEVVKTVQLGLQPLTTGSLRYQATQFLTVLTSELGTLPTFLVLPKEGYDVGVLTNNGAKLFPPAILQKAPETAADMVEVGKTLVFEMPTACGFHLFRVMEAVLKRYWDHVSSASARPNLETIGTYALELSKNSFGDAKVWETLAQINKLHRNPLIHPDVILSVEEAIEILGIARSVIGAMLRAMPEVPPTTTTPTAIPALVS